MSTSKDDDNNKDKGGVMFKNKEVEAFVTDWKFVEGGTLCVILGSDLKMLLDFESSESWRELAKQAIKILDLKETPADAPALPKEEPCDEEQRESFKIKGVIEVKVSDFDVLNVQAGIVELSHGPWSGILLKFDSRSAVEKFVHDCNNIQRLEPTQDD